jgi:hypothetical protein
MGFNAKKNSLSSMLFTDLYSKELDWSFSLFNIYGSYVGHEYYWNSLLGFSCI